LCAKVPRVFPLEGTLTEPSAIVSCALRPLALSQSHARAHRLPPLSGLIGLPQPHPRPATVLVDKFDASGFERAANGQIVSCGQGRLAFGKLCAADRGDP